MSCKGSIDIMHDKPRFYEGNTAAAAVAQKLSPAELAARRDNHGNYVGKTAEERIHYHQSLKKGQNTANSCIARLALRYLAEKNAEVRTTTIPTSFSIAFRSKWWQGRIQTMTKRSSLTLTPTWTSFVAGSSPKRHQAQPLSKCAVSQRDSWRIGSLDGVVLALPIVAAYANEAEWYVVGRGVEHHMLTHRSTTVASPLSVLVPLLLELYRGVDLRETLDRDMRRMRPPKITGRQIADSYAQHQPRAREHSQA